jgi:putative methylase
MPGRAEPSCDDRPGWAAGVSTRAALETQLAVVAGFDSPRAALEQYPTPPHLAASVVHDADLRGDVADCTVLDLGAGTGMLALGAALRGPARVVGVELDPAALATARENRRRVGARAPVGWVRADVTRLPVAADPARQTTVLTNPPFGAQRASEGSDRAFLLAASEVADVSYSVHNGGSRAFVESFVADHGGRVTASHAATLELDRQFDFHEADERAIEVEVHRVVWSAAADA